MPNREPHYLFSKTSQWVGDYWGAKNTRPSLPLDSSLSPIRSQSRPSLPFVLSHSFSVSFSILFYLQLHIYYFISHPGACCYQHSNLRSVQARSGVRQTLKEKKISPKSVHKNPLNQENQSKTSSLSKARRDH